MIGPEILFPFIGTVIAAFIGYMAAARRSSGRIDSSEAASLWEESANIREFLGEQVRQLNEKITMLEKQLERCHAHIREMEAQLRERQ